ncbi:hypothetical protein AAE478_010306 [Parahypoxylon ruwenzoriense]
MSGHYRSPANSARSSATVPSYHSKPPISLDRRYLNSTQPRGHSCHRVPEVSPSRSSNIAYPSDSEFEDTIVEDTAQLVHIIPQGVNADRVQHDEPHARRRDNSSLGSSKAYKGGSPLPSPSLASVTPGSRRPEHPKRRPITFHDVATAAYHDVLRSSLKSNARSPSPREPPKPFREKIHGRHFSQSPGSLREECASYAQSYIDRHSPGSLKVGDSTCTEPSADSQTRDRRDGQRKNHWTWCLGR